MGESLPTEQSGTVVASDGTRLATWSCGQTGSVGHVLIIHGAAEHSGRYRSLVEALVHAGFSVHRYDQRGCGRSGGRRGDVPTFERYVDDLVRVAEALGAADDSASWFLYGHSMGAVVTSYAAARDPDRWEGVVLASMPLALARPLPRRVHAAARLVGTMLPLLPVRPGLPSEFLSRDHTVVEEAERDPLMLRWVSLRWALETLKAIERLPTRVEAVRCPTLSIHGEEDRIALVAAVAGIAATMRDRDWTFVSYPRLFHELHNERPDARDRVFADVIDWLIARAGQVPGD